MASILTVIFVLWFFDFVRKTDQQRNLTVAPVNTIVLIGNRARLNCTTSYHESQVYWEHLPLGSQTSRNVYLGKDGLQGSYASQRRHSIQGNQSIGQYDLVIDDVSISDAGKYRCIDKSGLGSKSSAEFIVLESVPDCSSNVGSGGLIFEHECGMEPSYIQFVCSVSFHGNVVPSLEWSPESQYKDIPASFEVKLTPNKTTSSIVVHSVQNWTMPLEIVCWVKELENIPNQNHKCPHLKTVELTTSHVEKSTSTLEHSPVDCSDTPLKFCQFIWKNDNDEVIGQGLRLPSSERRTGERVSCFCHVPDKNCSFELLVLTVEDDKGPGVKTITWCVLAGIVPVAVLVILIVLTKILLRKKNVICNPEECCSCLTNNRPVAGENKRQQSSGSGDSGNSLLPNNGLSLEYTDHHFNDNDEKTCAINSKTQNVHYSPLSII